MSSETALNFSINWKINCKDFDALARQPLQKMFVSAYNGVPYRWKARFVVVDEARAENKFGFFLSYMDGPVDKLENIKFMLEILIMPNKTLVEMKCCDNFELKRGGDDWGYSKLATQDASVFRRKYGLTDSEPLCILVTVSIPVKAFDYAMENPLPTSDAMPWLREMFEKIEDASKAEYSNAKLISKDGKVFYCDKTILGNRSKVFAAMFRFDGEHPPIKKAKRDEYSFPKLGSSALKPLLEFIYTGRTIVSNLSTDSVIELVDAAEQYEFKELLLACGASLWNRVMEKPDDSFKIIQRCDLHDDLEYVRDRAFEVLIENCEGMRAEIDNISNWHQVGEVHFCAKKIPRLLREFNLYLCRRVGPTFPER